MIVVDKKVFERNRSGSVSVGIWLTFPSGEFPLKGWDDFALNILAALSRALLKLLVGSHGPETVYFLEGPFAVQLECGVHEKDLQVSAIERRKQTYEIKHVLTANRLAFASALLHASEEVLQWCEDAGWSSEEMSNLRGLTDELAKMVEPRLN